MPKLALDWADLDALVAASPRGPKPWSAKELAVLDRYYPQYGSYAVVMALKRLGYARSEDAVHGIASKRRLHYREA